MAHSPIRGDCQETGISSGFNTRMKYLTIAHAVKTLVTYWYNTSTLLQIEKHCSSQAEASANDVRDRGRVEQCLKDHVAQKVITATSNKQCFAVISILSIVYKAHVCYDSNDDVD